MFCKKCGYQIKEGLLFCPNCGEKAVGGAPNQHIEPKPQGKSLKKCAWYAPVSVFVAFILNLFLGSAKNNVILISRIKGLITYDSIDLKTLNIMLVSNFLSILIVGVIIPLIFYTIATRKVKKEIKKQVRSSSITPILSFITPLYLYNAWQLIIYNNDSISFVSWAWSELLVLIAVILATVLSYFITAKYFEKAEKKIFSEMLRE